jgi:hypothetical protein
VGVLRPGDEDLHYSDNSHRWIAPPDMEQSLWDAGMRAHLALHLSTVGGPIRAGSARCVPTARLARMGALTG